LQKYNFIAKDKNTQTHEGSIEARSRYDAITALKEQGLTVVSVSTDFLKKYRSKQDETPVAVKQKKKLFRSRGVGVNELSIFCRQLAVSVTSGISLVDSLESITDDMDNLFFKDILIDVVKSIRGGKHFSEAMAKHEKVFTPLFIAMIKSAEESGSMTTTLSHMSSLLENSERLRRKVRSITTYPLFIFGLFFAVILVVTIFLLPRFQAIFSNFGGELPFITSFVFGINKFLVRNMPFFILAIFGAIVGLIFYGRSEEGRYRIDRFKLNLPGIGDLIKKTSIARFCRVLAAMIRGGVPIETAIEVTSKVCDNTVLEKSLNKTREEIINGSDIASSLARDGNFPRLVTRMVGVGESSGQLPEVLDKVSDLYEDQVEGSVMVITSLFEPVMIVVFGGVILTLVLAIYVPVFKMAMGMK